MLSYMHEGANREQVLYVCSRSMYVCSKPLCLSWILNIHTWTSNIHTKLVHDLRPNEIEDKNRYVSKTPLPVDVFCISTKRKAMVIMLF